MRREQCCDHSFREKNPPGEYIACVPLVVVEKLLAFYDVTLGSEDFIVPVAVGVMNNEPFDVSGALVWVTHRALEKTAGATVGVQKSQTLSIQVRAYTHGLEMRKVSTLLDMQSKASS